MPNALSVALAALFADPNIGQDREDTAFAMLRAFVGHDVMVSAQALGDLFVVLTRKAKRNTAMARDTVILAGAAQAGCRLLLSEDVQDGFTWRGVTVRTRSTPRKSDGPGLTSPG